MSEGEFARYIRVRNQAVKIIFILMNENRDYTILKRYLNHHPSYDGFDIVPDSALEIAIVIPVYKEREYLFHTLDSLLQCLKPSGSVEIIMVFNCSERDGEGILMEQIETAKLVRTNYEQRFPQWINPLVIEAYNLSKKHFGAGLARKIGMDAASAHFCAIGKPDGIIVTLDADTLVKPDYFRAISSWFSDSSRNGASIYFEHPLEGESFSPDIYNAITKYELHLRYYLQALRYAGFPYAFHTMGSAMAMRAGAYARIGGMPRKQAGEDFYFLQKLIPLGNFGEITETAVYPSPRPSDRVIFGTGAAISKHVSGDSYVETTYSFNAYNDLKAFLQKKHELYNVSDYEGWTYELSGPMRSFLLNSGLLSEIDALKGDCSTEKVFNKRFFEVFNAFKIVKYLNYVHEHFFAKTAVFDNSLILLENMGFHTDNFFTEKQLLLFYRELEKKQPFFFR